MRQKKTQVMTIAFIFASVEDKFETNFYASIYFYSNIKNFIEIFLVPTFLNTLKVSRNLQTFLRRHKQTC